MITRSLGTWYRTVSISSTLQENRGVDIPARASRVHRPERPVPG